MKLLMTDSQHPGKNQVIEVNILINQYIKRDGNGVEYNI